MALFVAFVFGAIVLGAGAMLAPALPTHGPRIGLAGTLTLAFITTGTLFYAALFGWDTLVIDYMWFAAIVGIFFAGTLSAGMFRAEAAGGTQEYSGWPGIHVLAFLGVVALIFLVPLLVFPVPLDTDAQGFGYLALTLRESGSLTTLAPFHPEINYLYSPGFPVIVAYLSEQLGVGIHVIQFAVAAVLCTLFVWLAYDFGNELGPDDSRLTGMFTAFCALIGTGLALAYLDSHFTALLALVFALAFLTFAMRFSREGRRADFIGAAITLGAMPLAQPDMTIILGLGFGPWLLTMWLARPRPQFSPFFRHWLLLAIGVPLVAVMGVLPWITQIWPLLGSDIASPFQISASHLIQAVIYHGPVVPLAIGGLLIALRRRNSIDLLMIVWLAFVIDFSSLGVLKSLLGDLLEPVLRYDYPFSIAWHGPIIPYTYFGGQALVWLVERAGRDNVVTRLRRLSLPILGGVAVVAVILVFLAPTLLSISKALPFSMFGAFSSAADVRAMQWLAENRPEDTLILNHPGLYEADWAPVITERSTVFFRPQPFFRNTASMEDRQAELLPFWLNPDNSANADLLARHGVDYVLVPQIVTRPDTLTGMYRWRPMLPETARYRPVDDTPFLDLVFDEDGAQVWVVVSRSE